MTAPIPGAQRGRPKLKASERRVSVRASLSPAAATWLEHVVTGQVECPERAEVMRAIVNDLIRRV